MSGKISPMKINSIGVREISILIVNDLATALKQAEQEKEEAPLLQAALTIINDPVRLLGKMIGKQIQVTSILSKEKFSKIYATYGLNLFILSGLRKDLSEKFEQEFGQSDIETILQTLNFVDLKKLNQAGVISDEKFEKMRKEYRETFRAKFANSDFLTLYFDELLALRLKELDSDALFSTEKKHVFEPIFTQEELIEKLQKEFPSAEAMLAKFSAVQLIQLFANELITKEELAAIQKSHLEKLRTQGGSVHFSQLLDNDFYTPADEVLQSFDPVTSTLESKEEFLLHLFTIDELKEKLLAEFPDASQEEILQALPALNERTHLQAALYTL